MFTASMFLIDQALKAQGELWGFITMRKKVYWLFSSVDIFEIIVIFKYQVVKLADSFHGCMGHHNVMIFSVFSKLERVGRLHHHEKSSSFKDMYD